MNDFSTENISDSSLGFTINPGIMFTDHKGRENRRIEKRQRKLAEKVKFIDQFLENDEEVLVITQGLSPMSFMEQYLTGWVIYYIKRSLFVFTNKRILQVLTDKSYVYRNSIAQIRYADCQSLQIKGRTLIVQYKDGKKEKFHYLGRGERRKLKQTLKDVTFEGQQSDQVIRTFLCPRCTTALHADIFECSSCRLEFKNKQEGKKISIIYPGGGYFYTGHPILGVMDALVEFIFILVIIGSLLGVMEGIPEATGDLIAFTILLVFEKMITVYHSNHFLNEFIPKEKVITPIQA